MFYNVKPKGTTRVWHGNLEQYLESNRVNGNKKFIVNISPCLTLKFISFNAFPIYDLIQTKQIS